jgi:succinoglycan biosynthesis transport protein ExoP
MTVESKISGKPILSLNQGAEPEQMDAGSGFDLTALLQMMRVRQRIIIGTALAVFALVAIMVFRTTPLYDASAVVMLDQRENRVTDVNAVFSGLSTDETTMENQLQILRSRSLMAHVIDKLHLDQTPPAPPSINIIATAIHYANPLHWFGSPPDAKTAEQQAAARREGLVDGLLGSESVSEIGESSAMEITYRDADPNRAATFANAIADAYVEDQLNAKFEATQKTSQWLADRLQQLSAQMQAADAAVQQYKAENDITDTQGGGSLLDQQLVQLNGQLAVARSTLAEAEAKYARVRSLQASGRAEDVAQVFQSGMISQLRQQQADLMRQKAQFATVYGPRHPQMLDIESQIRNIDEKIKEEVERVVETVANDVSVAGAQVGSLQGSLSQLESKSAVQNKAGVKLAELLAKSSSAHQLYEAFLSKFKETQGQEGIQTPDARIISRAVVPGSPTVPNKRRALELAIAGGLALGFAIAWLAERLDSGFRTVTQVERILGVPVLSTLPELPELAKTQEQAADRVIEKPLSSFAEAVRGLQMGLVLSNVDKRPKTILITSSVPDEGKSTVALSLARSAARADQKVLLVDCDLRHPSIAGIMKLPDNQRGLIELMAGQAELDDCLIRDPKSNLQVLAATRTSAHPPDLLGSTTMEKLIAKLRAKFDMVIIDSAPLLPVNDTKILASMVDAVVFVVRWEKTPRDAVSSAARSLADVQAPVAGVVLARANAERHRYYSYGYQDYTAYHTYYND